MTRTRAFALTLGLVLAVAGCGSPPVAGGGGGGGNGGGTTADGGGANGKGGGVNDGGNNGNGGGTADGGGGGTVDGGSGGGTADGGNGGGTDGGGGGTVDGGGGGTDGGSGGVTDGGTVDGGTTDGGTTDGGTGGTVHHLKTVFLILMENNNWADIKGSSKAPYINSLLSTAAYTKNYHKGAVGTTHSEPNYLWLEAGTNFGIDNDNDPSSNHQGTNAHLVTLLHNAGISWKAYEENIDGTTCPISTPFGSLYAAKHNPMVFFDDTTGNLDKNDAYCIKHERPFKELKTDLQSGSVAAYNFITPNLCDDMHGYASGCFFPSISDGDNWLKTTIPMIMASQAYKDGGVIMITWDESESDSTCSSADAKSGKCPIGMIVLSPDAKQGYSNNIYYNHSSTLKTIEEIFGVHPLLGHAADSNVKDLRDLFKQFP